MDVRRSVVALVCIYSTLNLLGCGSSPQQQSNDLAAKITSQANNLTQQTKSNTTPRAVDLNSLASEIDRYVSLSEKDGSLAKHENAIRSKSPQALKDKNLKSALLEAASNFREMAQVSQARHIENPSVLPAAYYGGAHLIRVMDMYRCRVWGSSFNWIIAIGGVASLGGVDPLGDLLLAIGGVGAAVTFELC